MPGISRSIVILFSSPLLYSFPAHGFGLKAAGPLAQRGAYRLGCSEVEVLLSDDAGALCDGQHISSSENASSILWERARNRLVDQTAWRTIWHGWKAANPQLYPFVLSFWSASHQMRREEEIPHAFFDRVFESAVPADKFPLDNRRLEKERV